MQEGEVAWDSAGRIHGGYKDTVVWGFLNWKVTWDLGRRFYCSNMESRLKIVGSMVTGSELESIVSRTWT